MLDTVLGPVYTSLRADFTCGGGRTESASKVCTQATFTRDQIQMESDPSGSDPLFEGRLQGIRSRTVGVYTGSDPCRFYELLAAL